MHFGCYHAPFKRFIPPNQHLFKGAKHFYWMQKLSVSYLNYKSCIVVFPQLYSFDLKTNIPGDGVCGTKTSGAMLIPKSLLIRCSANADRADSTCKRMRLDRNSSIFYKILLFAGHFNTPFNKFILLLSALKSCALKFRNYQYKENSSTTFMSNFLFHQLLKKKEYLTTCVHMHCKRLPNHDQDLRTAR